MSKEEILARAAEFGTTVSIAGFGGFAHYLYRYSQGMPFRFGMFVMNIALAGYVWTLVGPMIEPGKLQYFAISVSGFSSLHILGFLEKGGWRYALNMFLRAFKLPEIPETQEGK